MLLRLALWTDRPPEQQQRRRRRMQVEEAEEEVGGTSANGCGSYGCSDREISTGGFSETSSVTLNGGLS